MKGWNTVLVKPPCMPFFPEKNSSTGRNGPGKIRSSSGPYQVFINGRKGAWP